MSARSISDVVKVFWLTACFGVVPVYAQAPGAMQASGPMQAPGLSPDQAVARTCQAEFVMFCPHDGSFAREPQNEVICLKDFRPDLSLGCRRQVDAALKGGEAAPDASGDARY